MIFVCLCRQITERIVQAHGYIADLQIYHGLFLYIKIDGSLMKTAKGQMIICVIPGRCYKRRPGDIIRGCHNRDKGAAENERLRNPKCIFSYPKNERVIFLNGRNAAQEEISTIRVG